MDQTLPERVAVLESQQVTNAETLQQISERLQNIHDDLTRYKGAMGVLFLVGSSMAAAVALLKDWVMAHWK